jgi:hypothetical protein
MPEQDEHHHKAYSDADGSGEEPEEHFGAEAHDLSKIAAKEHEKDHYSQKVTLDCFVGHVDAIRLAPESECGKEHAEEINSHYSGNIFEEFALVVLFSHYNQSCKKYDKCQIGKTIGDHDAIPPFLI